MKRLMLIELFFAATMTLSVVSCENPPSKGGSTIDNIIINTDSLTEDANKAIAVSDSLTSAAGATTLMVTKANSLRASFGAESGKVRNAVYVYSASRSKYASSPGMLAARLALLGFKDVYLSVTRSSLTAAATNSDQKWTREFITAAHNCKMQVYAMRFSDTKVYTNASLIATEANALVAYNSSVVAIERFDGVSADLEPHTCKEGSETYPTGLGYYWNSTTNYGIGKDNDVLVGKTLDVLSSFKTQLGQLKLCEAVFSQFQPKYNSGMLSRGSATDFLESCNWIMVMAYSDSKESVWASVEPFLSDSKSKTTVSVCVKVALNTYNGGDDSTSLKSKGWNYTIEALSYLLTRGSEYYSFRGIDFFQYEGFEQMWEWTTDSGA